MRSIFSFRIIAPILICCFTSILLVIVLPIFWDSIIYEPGFLVFYGLILFAWLWAIIGELRIRAVRVDFEFNRIVVRNYAGLGRARTFYYNDLDGYETKDLEARHGSYEYLFIKKQRKRLIRLSEYYHKNYKELKRFLQTKLPGTHSANTSLLEELKDMFG